jgi:hypothetical protein
LKRYGLDSQRDTVFFRGTNKLIVRGSIGIVIAGNSINLSLEDVEISSQDMKAGWLIKRNYSSIFNITIFQQRVKTKKE